MAMSPPRKLRIRARPGDAINVSRIEYENLETGVRANAARLDWLEAKFDGMSRELTEVKRLMQELKRQVLEKLRTYDSQ